MSDKWVPRRPKFNLIFDTDHRVAYGISRLKFNEWYDCEIRPIFEGAVEVGCYQLQESSLNDEHGPGWLASEDSTRVWQKTNTHKALLINIQPINEASAEDHLRALVEAYSNQAHDMNSTYCARIKIAKAYLKGKLKD